MICGSYKNEPVEDVLKVYPGELYKYLNTKASAGKLTDLNSLQVVDVSASSFVLGMNGDSYDICASGDKTEFGNFVVAEKWKFPYWKDNGRVYVPGSKNPIGEHLVILAGEVSLEKVSTSIHSWPLYPYADPCFSKGDGGTGCVRLKRGDMAKFFEDVEVGARVKIHR